MSTAARLQAILAGLGQPPLTPDQADAFGTYMALLQRWNEKVNLTAIRDEEVILRRHFVESILCARLLPAGIATLLDYGSGGGFPGIPCAICLPAVHVTLAEAQVKKAGFLQEAVRTLGLHSQVHAGRVEAMNSALLFDGVTLRAVDKMQEACAGAFKRLKTGGWIAIMATSANLDDLVAGRVAWRTPESLPGSKQEILLLGQRLPG